MLPSTSSHRFVSSAPKVAASRWAPTLSASVRTVRVAPARAVSVHDRVRVKVHVLVHATEAPHRARVRVVARATAPVTAPVTATTLLRVPAMAVPTRAVRVPAMAVPRVVLSPVAKAHTTPAAVLVTALAELAALPLLQRVRGHVRVMPAPHQLLDRVKAVRVKAAHRVADSASPWECLVATAASVLPAHRAPRAAKAPSLP